MTTVFNIFPFNYVMLLAGLELLITDGVISTFLLSNCLYFFTIDFQPWLLGTVFSFICCCCSCWFIANFYYFDVLVFRLLPASLSVKYKKNNRN